ncbi:hypothetical protein J6590_028138 [Homalodisca vitripennis]|nr:hypothetical protein J6590_028138 [Homalodisca vitripennis]
MSKDNDDQRIRQFLDLPSSELGYNLDSEDDDFDDPDYLPDTNDESNEQFINISDCELVFENSDILVTKTIDSVVNGKDSIDEPGPSSRPTTNQCKPPMRKRKACFRNPSNEKKRSNTKYPHIWKSGQFEPIVHKFDNSNSGGEGGAGARPRLPPPPLSLLDLFPLQDTSGNRVLCFPALVFWSITLCFVILVVIE